MLAPKIRNKRILFITQFSMMLAFELIVCFASAAVAVLFGPVTVALLPVIATSLLMGTAAGTLMGLFSGVFNLLLWSFLPSAPAMAFFFSPVQSFGDVHGNGWSVVICILPRVLCGLLTGLFASLMRKVAAGKKHECLLVYGLSGVIGSLSNTVFVTTLMYLCFGIGYLSPDRIEYTALFTTIMSMIYISGVPEAILGGLTGYWICRPLTKHLRTIG